MALHSCSSMFSTRLFGPMATGLNLLVDTSTLMEKLSRIGRGAHLTATVARTVFLSGHGMVSDTLASSLESVKLSAPSSVAWVNQALIS